MRVYTVALHGDFARGQDLREDMQEAPWVDWWPDWKREPRSTFRTLTRMPALILAGYSSGGARIAALTHHLPNIVGVIPYECPAPVVPAGKAPCLACWNDASWAAKDPDEAMLILQRRRVKRAHQAMCYWRHTQRPYRILWGHGGHLRPTDQPRPRTLGLAHNWCPTLLDRQEQFVSRIAEKLAVASAV